MIAAPFTGFAAVVRPDWIDANGHMNLAWYVLLFDQATDLLFTALGIGDSYRTARAHALFAVEAHTLYRRELVVGEEVRVRSLLLGADGKRLHLAHEMLHGADGGEVAMQELMFLHVGLATRRVAPWPDDVAKGIAAAVAAHGALPRPAWIGRRIALAS